MPRKEFISTFPTNETDPAWLDQKIASGEAYGEKLAEEREEFERYQRRLQAIEEETKLTVNQIKEISRQGTPRQERNGGSKPETGYLDR